MANFQLARWKKKWWKTADSPGDLDGNVDDRSDRVVQVTGQDLVLLSGQRLWQVGFWWFVLHISFTFQVTDVWSLMHLMSGEFLVTYWCVISSDQQVMGRSQWRNCCRLHNYAPITQPPVLRPGFFQPCQHFLQMWHCQKGWTNR